MQERTEFLAIKFQFQGIDFRKEIPRGGLGKTENNKDKMAIHKCIFVRQSFVQNLH